jgi:hypothetical protein
VLGEERVALDVVHQGNQLDEHAPQERIGGRQGLEVAAAERAIRGRGGEEREGGAAVAVPRPFGDELGLEQHAEELEQLRRRNHLLRDEGLELFGRGPGCLAELAKLITAPSHRTSILPRRDPKGRVPSHGTRRRRRDRPARDVTIPG